MARKCADDFVKALNCYKLMKGFLFNARSVNREFHIFYKKYSINIDKAFQSM